MTQELSKPIKQAIIEQPKLEAQDLTIIKDFENLGIEIKKLQEQQDVLKQDVLDIMEDYDLTSYETESGNKISYVKAGTRSTLDSTRLKKDHPGIVDDYQKVSVTKASVRFTVKK